MQIKNIEILLRALELGSLSKAAEEYLYTPSAVSHILDAIESEIGTRVIKRTYKGVEPEEGCEEILECLKQLVKTENHIMKLAADQKKGKTSIRIGTYSSISKYILPQIVKGFKEKYPDTDIDIIVGVSMKDICESKEADIMLGEKTDAPDMVWEELIRDPYVAVFPPSYANPSGTLKREELHKLPFIMADESSLGGYIEDASLKNMIHVKSHDDSSILQMVKSGMGASILPSLSVENENCLIRKELDPKPVRILGLMYRKNEYKRNKQLRRLLEYIRQSFVNTAPFK